MIIMALPIIDAKKIHNHMETKVIITRFQQGMIRYKVGLWLIKLAAFIMWTNVEVVESDDI